MVVHARSQAGRAVRGHGVGGHGDDGQLAQAPPQVLANGACGGVAIHHRHLDVHQYHIKRDARTGHCGHAQLPVLGQHHHGALRV